MTTRPTLSRPPRPSAPLVSIADGALPTRLFVPLARAVRALGTEGLRRTYETTFWFDLGAPSALPERAVLALRPRVPRPPRGAIAGVEWWLSRMRTSDVRVDFHRDRDEAGFARTGVEVHPLFSSVLFLNRSKGGLLAVTTALANDANPARAPDDLDADLVRPRPNRFVLFPGEATHGVLDANDEIPRRRLSPATPLRLALVMNWWARRPTAVQAFTDARRYPRLRLARPATG